MACEICECGNKEGELSNLVKFNWDEAEEVEVNGRESEFSLDLNLEDVLLDLSLSVFIQLDSSCLDK